MKVLVACEKSRTVCRAFRARGHEAYSCDIKASSGGFCERHMQMGIGSFGSDRWTIIGAETGKRKNKAIPEHA